MVRRCNCGASDLPAVLIALLCLYLMLNLTGGTWVRFLVWMAIGVVFYLVYGRTHSGLARRAAESERQEVA